jgi:phosphatidate cytidylyltransferase
MTNLSLRIVTALVLGGVLITAMFVLPEPVAELTFAFFFVTAAWEWSGFILRPVLLARLAFTMAAVLLAVFPLIFDRFNPVPVQIFYLALAYWSLIGLLLFFNKQKLPALVIALSGVFALLPAWYALSFLATAEHGNVRIVECLLIVAAADIGAYFTGKRFGKRKLAPAISPGKTWEGFAGGMLCAALVTVLLSLVLHDNFSVQLILLGFVLAAVSVIGDLWVSLHKRAAGLKDSGKLLPGHGGVLDRIDGLIAALPVFVIATISGVF